MKISDFVPNNRHLREVLIFFFHSKKTVAEAHRELQKVYGDAALSETTCRDWLEALLDEDPCQTQEELASALGVTRQAISKQWHALGMVQKQGTWVPYDLKPRDVERRFFACEQLLQPQERKGFSNPKRRKLWGLPGHASTSSALQNIHAAKVMLCIWWDQAGVIYYELLNPNATITRELYRTQLMRLSRALHEKRPQYEQRHKKVILQHDNSRPHVAKPVKTYLEKLKWEVLPHPSYSPDIAPFDYYSMAHVLADQQFSSYEDIEKWLHSWIASKDEHFYRNGIRALPERWVKVVANDGQYFE